MARPVKKPPEQWKHDILQAAQTLFLKKGYEETSVSDIMNAVGGAKGMFYRCFTGKEQMMQALGDALFFKNNPFEAVRGRTDLNGLQKMRELLLQNQSDTVRDNLNTQASSILKDPAILAAAIESNRRVLTPLWYELLEEGRKDGSIQTEYTKEISELLALMNFWLLPSVYPDTVDGLRHKFEFIVEVLAKMGLPLWDDALKELAQQKLTALSPD